MTLQWIDGFENDQNTTDITRKYSSVSGNIAVATGRFLGKALSFDTGSTTIITPVLSSHTTWVVGFSGYAVNTTFGSSPLSVVLRDSSLGSQLSFIITPSSTTVATVVVKRGGTTLGTSTSFSISGWNTYEFKATIHTSAGAYEVRVNGISILSGSSANTANGGGTTADKVDFFGLVNTSGSTLLDDIYICNGAGSVRNNFLGTCVVEGLTPNGDGSSTQWTPFGGGAHYTEVDEQNADDDTSYIETADNAKKDMFGFSNLAFITGNILGVQVNSQAKVSVAGTRTFSHVFRDTGLATEDEKAAKTVNSTTYDHFFDVWEQNPESAADFTVADINNGEFGVLSVA